MPHCNYFGALLTGLLLSRALLPLQAQDAAAYEQKQDLVYGEVHGTGLLMDVFTPTARTNGLAVVDVVSGAWHSDRGKIRDHTLAQIYTILCRHGYTVFAVRPGSITRYTAAEMTQNLKTGIRWVKDRANAYHIDPTRLGLTGASAGAHLALLAAATPEDGQPNAKTSAARQDTRVRAVAVFFPPTDFLDWDGKPALTEVVGRLLFVGGAAGHNDDEVRRLAEAASPARVLKQTTLPFLIFHGDADPLVPLQQSRRMVEAIKAAGGSAELIVKPGGGHPWLTIPEEVETMAKWFDRTLSGDSATPAANPAPANR